MLIEIFKWHLKFMNVYPRQFSIIHQKIRGFLFNRMIKKYNPVIEVYKDIHPDPESSKYTNSTKYTFNDFSIGIGGGGHPYGLAKLIIHDKDYIPFGDGIVA